MFLSLGRTPKIKGTKQNELALMHVTSQQSNLDTPERSDDDDALDCLVSFYGGVSWTGAWGNFMKVEVGMTMGKASRVLLQTSSNRWGCAHQTLSRQLTLPDTPATCHSHKMQRTENYHLQLAWPCARVAWQNSSSVTSWRSKKWRKTLPRIPFHFE